jgi:hypothetical protein
VIIRGCEHLGLLGIELAVPSIGDSWGVTCPFLPAEQGAHRRDEQRLERFPLALASCANFLKSIG